MLDRSPICVAFPSASHLTLLASMLALSCPLPHQPRLEENAPPPSIYVVSAFICNLGRAVLTNHTVDDTDPSVIYDTPGEGGPYPCNPTICNAPGTPDENNYGQMIQGTMTVVPDGVLTTIRFTGIPLLYDCPMRLNSLFTCSLSQAIQFVFSLRLEMIRPVRFSSTVKASVGSSIPRPLPPLTVCWATEIHPCQMGPRTCDCGQQRPHGFRRPRRLS
ncbi:hypothetical protein B0H10DRAFT_1213086 [Mycena sp. CBHHK59/15]|nr:hypothetical protein B0H10DRAFT_1213086 [Mycena sp. CBHHK59/15]